MPSSLMTYLWSPRMNWATGFPKGGAEVGFLLPPFFILFIILLFFKDWRLLKPKMHVAYEEDPAPDSSEFYNHVYCEHGGLSLNTTLRRRISREVNIQGLLKKLYLIVSQAVVLLQKLFPAWTPIDDSSETCAICDAEVHISKEDKREIRRRVEEEKVVSILKSILFKLSLN